jgi:phosphate transport system ATP-binding protein
MDFIEESIMNKINTINDKDVFQTKDLNLWYDNNHVLKDINLNIELNKVTAIIGPSGCGKSTFIKTLNRMVELTPNVKTTGEILFNNEDIFSSDIIVEELRTNVGMVFQKPNPFPKSIYENVVYGPKLLGVKNKKELMKIAEESLKNAALWDEVKDRLKDNAYSLSGGQQQRLCIARCLAVKPQVILMDEPTSALDPIATSKIEELIEKLKEDYTIVIVTHSMQQARRISDKTAFFLSGEIIETDTTENIFNIPKNQKTFDYVNGKFG